MSRSLPMHWIGPWYYELGQHDQPILSIPVQKYKGAPYLILLLWNMTTKWCLGDILIPLIINAFAEWKVIAEITIKLAITLRLSRSWLFAYYFNSNSRCIGTRHATHKVTLLVSSHSCEQEVKRVPTKLKLEQVNSSCSGEYVLLCVGKGHAWRLTWRDTWEWCCRVCEARQPVANAPTEWLVDCLQYFTTS